MLRRHSQKAEPRVTTADNYRNAIWRAADLRLRRVDCSTPQRHGLMIGVPGGYRDTDFHQELLSKSTDGRLEQPSAFLLCGRTGAPTHVSTLQRFVPLSLPHLSLTGLMEE